MPEIIHFFENNAHLVVVFLVVLAMGMLVEYRLTRKQDQPWGQSDPWRWHRKRSFNNNHVRLERPEPTSASAKRLDAADQLRIVMGARYTARPLLNNAELRLYKELDQMVVTCDPRWRVMAQVSLGEILRGDSADAHSCINSKRVDLLLVDEQCRPREVLEYQGKGHYQGTAAARDAVKKEALRRAGIGYHEVVADRTTPSELKRLVERLIGEPDRTPILSPSSAATA